jgi:hypothetical protein
MRAQSTRIVYMQCGGSISVAGFEVVCLYLQPFPTATQGIAILAYPGTVLYPSASLFTTLISVLI